MRIQNNVILAADSDIGACDDGSLAGVLIGQFITIGRSVQVASTNQTYAEETGYDFANCNNVTADTTVIITRKGEENKIIDQNGCYIIQFKECDILKSTERFIVGVLASYNNIIL
ncbi:hypothetical protein COV11_03695 [Candidatus Woesearchaeota archaeon CG10_big_fil_rev_8_21_14_0_10_30_7]|nr:MAG: hypothetical protein COV11_03695 [Candidatus Woesearchaeota archaeon CG10_big_fil_rev_8_21_14_0_10_30_7]